MSEIERGRLAHIVDEALFRCGIRPKYSVVCSAAALHQLLKSYQDDIAALEQQLADAVGEIELLSQGKITSMLMDRLIKQGWRPPRKNINGRMK